MMRRPATIALVIGAALAPIPAIAALAPQYYEQARANAPNVIVFDVLTVTPPAGESGDCKVAGRVIRAERGDRYAQGDAVEILVPCMTPRASVKSGPTVWQQMDALVRSAHGKAWLDDQGYLVLDQYELFDLR